VIVADAPRPALPESTEDVAVKLRPPIVPLIVSGEIVVIAFVVVPRTGIPSNDPVMVAVPFEERDPLRVNGVPSQVPDTVRPNGAVLSVAMPLRWWPSKVPVNDCGAGVSSYVHETVAVPLGTEPAEPVGEGVPDPVDRIETITAPITTTRAMAATIHPRRR
jgi:hypothetical protein